ncbi:MAG: UDP-4-amino-4,6-dideoxy-N-acetyl-beta-L-altrosamine transaminase [Oxalobacteraceae bacterium]|nr:UDP-4-amino-4,6-dideoxy-N-acetyl-beta-L-altrosamine transaminase [Oxalobacteraceae bacterium]
MIPYGRQQINQADIDAVLAVLNSDFLTQGPQVPAFEAAVAQRCGAGHGVAFSSATAALHVACLALDLGPGDWLWTSPNTFVASANCALYCGAHVDFVDIDPGTLNMSVSALEQKLCEAQRSGCLPKLVMPVHFAGQPCDMKAIHELSVKFGFRIIEDASHAIGATYRGEPVGNCRYSDIAVFSFHPVKIITTAEGGLATTNDPAIAKRMQLLRSHGITRDTGQMLAQDRGAWHYEQHELGFNYRMTEIQAALGVSQLCRLDEFVQKRTILAERYSRLLDPLPLNLPTQLAWARSAWHLQVVEIHGDAEQRRGVFDHMRAKRVGVNVHYVPVYLQPYWQALGYRRGLCPNAEAYFDRAITLPLYPGLTPSEQDSVVSALAEALQITSPAAASEACL